MHKEKISNSLLAAIMLLTVSTTMVSCLGSEDNPTQQASSTNRRPGQDYAVTEKDENSTITYQYSDKVIPLSSNAEKYLVKVEADSILYYTRNTPDSILPKVGSLLSSRISEKLPYGLGNKVLSREEEGDMVKFVTTIAPIEEIFDELQVESDYSLTDFLVNTDGFYDDEGNYYEMEVKDINDVFDLSDYSSTRFELDWSIGSRQVLEITVNKKTESGLFADFKLYLGAIFTFNMDTEKKIYEISLEPVAGFNGNLGIKGDSKKPLYNLLELIKKKNLFQGTLPIAGGLITLRPYIDFEANIIGAVEGQISVGTNHYISFKCGWNEKGWFTKNTSKIITFENIFNSIEIVGKAQIGPEMTFHLGCGLYYKNMALQMHLSPSLLFGIELGAVANNNGNTWAVNMDQSLTMDLDLNVRAELYLKFLGQEIIKENDHKIDLANIHLLNLSWPIFPELDRESFEIKTKTQDPLVLDANFALTGGVMSRVLKGTPAIRIVKDDELVDQQTSNEQLYAGKESMINFSLKGLERDISYVAIPCIIYGNSTYEWLGKAFKISKEDDDDEDDNTGGNSENNNNDNTGSNTGGNSNETTGNNSENEKGVTFATIKDILFEGDWYNEEHQGGDCWDSRYNQYIAWSDRQLRYNLYFICDPAPYNDSNGYSGCLFYAGNGRYLMSSSTKQDYMDKNMLLITEWGIKANSIKLLGFTDKDEYYKDAVIRSEFLSIYDGSNWQLEDRFSENGRAYPIGTYYYHLFPSVYHGVTNTYYEGSLPPGDYEIYFYAIINSGKTYYSNKFYLHLKSEEELYKEGLLPYSYWNE